MSLWVWVLLCVNLLILFLLLHFKGETLRLKAEVEELTDRVKELEEGEPYADEEGEDGEDEHYADEEDEGEDEDEALIEKKPTRSRFDRV